MMQIEESPARKAGKPNPTPRHRANTRMARMIAACGLSQVEAAAYLGISRKAVAMKAAALRPMFADEEDRLVELWRRIENGSIDHTAPAGSQRMAIAIMEMRVLSKREKPKASTKAAGPDLKIS